MGIRREGGYSATVEGFLVWQGQRFGLAKTNSATFVLVEPCQLPPGTAATLRVIVDGEANSRQVRLPDGIIAGQMIVRYEVEAPF